MNLQIYLEIELRETRIISYMVCISSKEYTLIILIKPSSAFLSPVSSDIFKEL